MTGHDDQLPGKMPPCELDPLQQLRSAMEQVRRMRESGLSGYAIETARYEADSNPVNQLFLDKFFMALPIKLRYDDPEIHWRQKNYVELGRPTGVAPALAFTVAQEYDHHLAPHIGFVIGERLSQDEDGTTELLFTSNTAKNPMIVVKNLKVATAHWNAKRNDRFQRMIGTNESTEIAERYNPASDAFVIFPKDLLVLAARIDGFGGYTTISTAFRKNRVLFRTDKKDPNRMLHLSQEQRSIRASDFEEFNVLYHLEVLAAAFDVDETFDQLKAEREAALPPSLEESIFGVPEYRTAIERTDFPTQ